MELFERMRGRDETETVYGVGRSFDAAARKAYDALPDDGHVEVVDDVGIDLGSRERYDSRDEVDTDAEASVAFDLKAVEVEYRHDPSSDPGTTGEEPYHPLDDFPA